MSDPTDMFPELPPDQEAAVRDLLGSLDAPEMPADVQARLDSVIVERAAARSGSAGSGARRNVRRLALAWVGAAAAAFVIVAGIGVVGQQLRGGGSGADSMSAQDDSAAKSVAPSSPHRSELSNGLTESSEQSYDADPADRPVIRPGHVAGDAMRLLDSTPIPTGARIVPSVPAEGCVARREPRPGVQVFAVNYQDEPAVLIVSEGPPRTASVWSCGNKLLARAALPE